MWKFEVAAGLLCDPAGLAVPAYSGHGDGRDNPEMEAVSNVGPIPRGRYSIGAARWSEKTGPITITLTPIEHNAHGRTAFEVHGDSITKPGEASHGCIITNPKTRGQMRDSEDRILEVF